MKSKSFRRTRRLKRKVKEAEKRVNAKVITIMHELAADPKVMKEIDDEINKAGGPKAFLESQSK